MVFTGSFLGGEAMPNLDFEKLGGFVKFYRKILKSPLWKECTPERKVILFTMVLLANHAERKVMLKNGDVVVVKRGQFITSYRNLADECGKGITKDHVESALKFFKKANFCRYERIQDRRQSPTIVTIVNWGFYQGNSKNADSNADSNADKVPTEQEYKEYKEYNNMSDSKESDHSPGAFKGDNNNSNKTNENTITTKSKEEKEKEKNSAKKKEKEQQIKEVVEYLNLKANRNYRPGTPKTKSLISARLKDYTIEDLKAVIDFKVGEWLENEKMNKYLRPETLFNETKFENYINELPSQATKKSSQSYLEDNDVELSLDDIIKINLGKTNKE